jgi:hypothetical protein
LDCEPAEPRRYQRRQQAAADEPGHPNPALLTALAAGPRRESPSAFSVEWQLPLPTRDLIVREDNGDVVVDVGDMTRGAGADLGVFVDASPSARERGGPLTLSAGFRIPPKRG